MLGMSSTDYKMDPSLGYLASHGNPPLARHYNLSTGKTHPSNYVPTNPVPPYTILTKTVLAQVGVTSLPLHHRQPPPPTPETTAEATAKTSPKTP